MTSRTVAAVAVSAVAAASGGLLWAGLVTTCEGMCYVPPGALAAICAWAAILVLGGLASVFVGGRERSGPILLGDVLGCSAIVIWVAHAADPPADVTSSIVLFVALSLVATLGLGLGYTIGGFAVGWRARRSGGRSGGSAAR